MIYVDNVPFPPRPTTPEERADYAARFRAYHEAIVRALHEAQARERHAAPR